MRRIPLIAPLLMVLSSNCGWEENLPEIDIYGTVTVPGGAATRVVTDDQGNETEIKDPRFLGPVFLGAFASVQEGQFDYPHPEMGPVITGSYPGDTFPYGGTSVGRFSFACYETTACRVVTGRFTSFDSILEYFSDYIQEPVEDPYGEEVTSGKVFEQYCLDYYYVTSLQEFTFLALDDDLNEDLDFTENADGDFEAEFEMLHTPYHEGMQIWGWIDSPSADSFRFSTCDESREGPDSTEYNLNFDAGGAHADILNFPNLYINTGDWVSTQSFTMTSREDEPHLVLDFHYE